MNRTDEHIADKPNGVGFDIYAFLLTFGFEASISKRRVWPAVPHTLF